MERLVGWRLPLLVFAKDGYLVWMVWLVWPFWPVWLAWSVWCVCVFFVLLSFK